MPERWRGLLPTHRLVAARPTGQGDLDTAPPFAPRDLPARSAVQADGLMRSAVHPFPRPSSRVDSFSRNGSAFRVGRSRAPGARWFGIRSLADALGALLRV